MNDPIKSILKDTPFHEMDETPEVIDSKDVTENFTDDEIDVDNGKYDW